MRRQQRKVVDGKERRRRQDDRQPSHPQRIGHERRGERHRMTDQQIRIPAPRSARSSNASRTYGTSSSRRMTSVPRSGSITRRIVVAVGRVDVGPDRLKSNTCVARALAVELAGGDHRLVAQGLQPNGKGEIGVEVAERPPAREDDAHAAATCDRRRSSPARRAVSDGRSRSPRFAPRSWPPIRACPRAGRLVARCGRRCRSFSEPLPTGRRGRRLPDAGAGSTGRRPVRVRLAGARPRGELFVRRLAVDRARRSGRRPGTPESPRVVPRR